MNTLLFFLQILWTSLQVIKNQSEIRMYTQPPLYLTASAENSLSSKKESVRFLTQYYISYLSQDAESINKIPNALKVQPIFQMYTYTQSNVYFSKAYHTNLNKQLKWNEKSFDLLKSSLGGENKSIIVQFQLETLKLRVFSEFNESSIRILLFEVDLVCLHKEPIKHAQSMLNMVSVKHSERINQLKTENKIKQLNFDKLEALYKQVTDQHEFEINMAKDKFLIVINEVKKRLRPHFGIEEKKEEDEDTQTRTIYRIKHSRSSNKQQSQNLLNLFD